MVKNLTTLCTELDAILDRGVESAIVEKALRDSRAALAAHELLSAGAARIVNDPQMILHLIPDACRYQAGDMITFEKANGMRWIVTILGMTDAGDQVLMFWDGHPHLLYCSTEDLDRLRIVRVEPSGKEALAEWWSILTYPDGCEPVEMRAAA